jgi:hypothetical protein
MRGLETQEGLIPSRDLADDVAFVARRQVVIALLQRLLAVEQECASMTGHMRSAAQQQSAARHAPQVLSTTELDAVDAANLRLMDEAAAFELEAEQHRREQFDVESRMKQRELTMTQELDHLRDEARQARERERCLIEQLRIEGERHDPTQSTASPPSLGGHHSPDALANDEERNGDRNEATPESSGLNVDADSRSPASRCAQPHVACVTTAPSTAASTLIVGASLMRWESRSASLADSRANNALHEKRRYEMRIRDLEVELRKEQAECGQLMTIIKQREHLLRQRLQPDHDD